jgi:hypothetical protein
LRRGRRRASYGVEEVDSSSSVPVIREYIKSIPITRTYGEFGADASNDDIKIMAPHHPVFRLTQLGP